MGNIVSIFTMTATVVGGAYINGTAEIMASSGITWTQAPIGYCIALFVGGNIYAPKMRRSGYMTIFDPFQIKLGKKIGTLMCLPQFMGDLFWTAAILAALGSTVSIILDMDETISIISSACIAIFYTLLGGLWSVAYTDVVQLICIAIGLVAAVPFAMTHESVNFERIQDSWRGEVKTSQIGLFIDVYGLLLLGGIPWQVYFQRILACKSPERARLASSVASIAIFFFAVPAVMMGATGAATDWNQTAYNGTTPIPPEKMSYILPLVLQYLCPLPVSIIGMGAIAAAVMSSADSSILSTSSVFAKNIYMEVIRPNASEKEIIWVVRIAVVVAGTLGTFIALSAETVYGLYILCSDLMYVILFPQFTCVLFIEVTNGYGCLVGYFLSVVLRILGGEPLIGLPVLLKFPFFSEETGQNFPFRTLTMACSFITIVLVSKLTEMLFKGRYLPREWDVFGCSEPSYRKRLQKYDEQHQHELYNLGLAKNRGPSKGITETLLLKESEPTTELTD
ncbi:high affinity choline transporter 1 [Patella vulgata]|uniref:high affinity choline transporter 1 n=1 Tax=Patella vulgata TaxID=6465 RepID=UPI0024A8942F|nr:high affinity choline transporter 1 [Patella vulgata]